MEIIDIVKESFIFPSKNVENLVMYIVVRFVFTLFLIGSAIASSFALSQNHFPIVGTIFLILTLIVEFIILGYKLSLLKSGIKHDEDAPRFVWKADLIKGIKVFVVRIVYLIIPLIVVIISALILNVPGQAYNIIQKHAANVTNVSASANNTAVNIIPQSSINTFLVSLSIIVIIAAILYMIFSFLEIMGKSRYANTGNLAEALNLVEAFKDISRIGVGKVVGVILFVFIISFVITTILSYIYQLIPELSLLSIVVIPYLVFFAERANGLLYSDIA